MVERKLRKQRLSTKDRFQGVLWSEKSNCNCDKPLPWYRLRRNYLPLLMIAIFCMLWFAVEALNLGEDTGTDAVMLSPQQLPVVPNDANVIDE